MTRPDHPLTARVLVNRVWQHHFGKGLVATPDNFGRTGSPPTHPELLDWLAVEFASSGWRLKDLHRLIVTSTVYRQASRRRDPAAAVDPENTLWWRMPLRRMDAESIRDAILSISGTLDPTMLGPPPEPVVDEEGQVDSKGSRRPLASKRLRPPPEIQTPDPPRRVRRTPDDDELRPAPDVDGRDPGTGPDQRRLVRRGRPPRWRVN